MANEILDAKDKNYFGLIDSIGALLDAGRKEAYRAVNQILVKTYEGNWETDS